jgi:lysophospholipase L1-like esterase
MFVPDVAQTHHAELQYINQVLASLTDEMDIPFADITPMFESASDPRVFYFWPRDWHTNAKGHEKMAEALVPLVCHVLQQKNVQCKQTDHLRDGKVSNK